jgi:alpha-tubulin suppressor-like RCC1 family protein
VTRVPIRPVLWFIASIALALPAVAVQSHVFGWGAEVANSSWTHDGFVGIAAGESHSFARRSDGSLVAWGENDFGQCVVAGGFTCVEVAAGFRHDLARRSDGSILAWGDNLYGQCNVPPLPAGLTYL